jgi:hypothetical protein
MTNTSTLALLALMAMLSLTSPTLAQAFDPDAGSGNLVPGPYMPDFSTSIVRTAQSYSGLYAYTGLYANTGLRRLPYDGALHR